MRMGRRLIGLFSRRLFREISQGTDRGAVNSRVLVIIPVLEKTEVRKELWKQMVPTHVAGMQCLQFADLNHKSFK
ncbi:hypothetical protein BT69DRAFT_433494 [Atractiella rhizophila]|nr:hypothetical protein BT69DRAFT_433494 [Atractiella rhizophila]